MGQVSEDGRAKAKGQDLTDHDSCSLLHPNQGIRNIVEGEDGSEFFVLEL